MTDEEWLVRRIFADPAVPHSLAEAQRRGLVPPEFRAQADKLLGSYPYPRRARTALPARSASNDPSWDNVIRAAEEDR